jgi:hypothetical protein
MRGLKSVGDGLRNLELLLWFVFEPCLSKFQVALCIHISPTVSASQPRLHVM